MERNTRAKMLGEALREVGVLTVVFIPLDHLYAEQQVVPTWVALAGMIWGFCVWAIGVLIEEKRQ